ncbi:DUF58 domain-containing protein [bacterium]|nr:DUF58 domain-containing protein [bacterium]NUN44075.1 DUF58 domain-containing protein [bacterium]
METKELLRNVRRIEIKTRGLVNNVFSGEYHSVFKGRGMSFSEVREYQFGDEIRFIDWNVSARLDKPYLKIFEEEREQTLMIIFDASASGDFGTNKQTKRELMIEMAAVVAFSAIKNNDKVGLMIYTEEVEKFIPPKKGRSHVLRLIRELIAFAPKARGTRIAAPLELTSHILKRRSIVFVISDFLDQGFDTSLRTLAKKHDVIGLRVADQREHNWPQVGLVTLEDEETGALIDIDTADQQFHAILRQRVDAEENRLKEIFKRSRVDLINIFTGSDYAEALISFFRKREKRH